MKCKKKYNFLSNEKIFDQKIVLRKQKYVLSLNELLPCKVVERA